MIENEEIFLEFLVGQGVGSRDKVASSPKSYVSYLNSVSKILGIRVSAQTVSDFRSVEDIVSRLKGSRNSATISNYKSALNQYAKMVSLNNTKSISRKGDDRIIMPPKTNFETRGSELRVAAKNLVLEFMESDPKTKFDADGMKQAQIFKRCGFDWGTYPIATSSNQQYWVAAILWELKAEGKIERVSKSGPWRLTQK